MTGRRLGVDSMREWSGGRALRIWRHESGSDEWVCCWCGSYDEKMAAETLLTKMNLKNYQVRMLVHGVWRCSEVVSMGVGCGGRGSAMMR